MFSIFQKKKEIVVQEEYQKEKLVRTEQFKFQIILREKTYNFSKSESEFLISIIRDLTEIDRNEIE
jgi:hypothetical protein